MVSARTGTASRGWESRGALVGDEEIVGLVILAEAVWAPGLGDSDGAHSRGSRNDDGHEKHPQFIARGLATALRAARLPVGRTLRAC